VFTSHTYKQRLISVWSEFKQSVIGKAIDQWQRPRLKACVHASGNTLNNWLIKIAVRWTVLFLERHFCVPTSKLKTNVHVLPSYFVTNGYFNFCKVVWRRYSDEVGKSYRILQLLSKTLNIIFYQNCLKYCRNYDYKIGVFLCLTV